ncbi:glycosyl hydrolase 115 family protein [Actinophytocola sp.]|uniref:glycosyl hydrolase 115 family protein n=1 Tax=Actinophytocola sp. TaxID=1872138 RepID=UPI003899B5AC
MRQRTPVRTRGGPRRAVAALIACALHGALLTTAPPASAADDGFTIYDGAATTPILIDGSYHRDHDDRDYRQVRRAVQDLRQDVAMVTGAIDAHAVQGLFADDEAAEEDRLAGADPRRVPALLTEARGARTAIIVGVIGQSELVDGIIAAGRFDEAAKITGAWEAYAVKAVDNPVPGVGRALVVAGSDPRGAIYGTYSISERLGVSPWYWFSDVPVRQRNQIVVPGAAHVDDGPDVKYRGIFINDEERTIDWAKAKFPTDRGTPDVNYYRHVYELLLRLGLNTLWPAMHEGTTSFNAATDTGMYDTVTPVNAREAAAYGVIMSSSHAEPMLRSNVEEWQPFYERNKDALDIKGDDYRDAFDYSVNKPAIIEYWRERLVANARFESVVPLGLRGVHDDAPNFTPGNPYGFADVLAMVSDVLVEQRALIAEVYGSADAVPQVFIPYKEMGDLYNNGLKAHIPPDVTVMWSDDNVGYVRQVPTATEAARPGGNGLYYHISYWGSPKSYLWLNSTPTALTVEQLHRAWHSGAGRFWILNVGDIKPGEMKTELFAKLAWDVDGHDNSDTDRFLTHQVTRDFGLGGRQAEVVVDALDRFSRLESTKRAEFWGASSDASADSGVFPGERSYPFSPTSDGDELQRYVNEANELVHILEGVEAGLDGSYRSAFYQQITHRVRSYRNMAEQLGYYWKNQLYAAQGRYGSAAIYALLSKRARERIRSDEAYWNTRSGGKWDRVIGYSHPSGGNQGVVMLTDNRYAAATPADGIGANAEGQQVPGSGTLRFSSAAPDDARFFDVFTRNAHAEQWAAQADVPWLTLSDTSGTTATEHRVTVSVDWARLKASATGTVRVYHGPGGVRAGDPVAAFAVTADRAIPRDAETAVMGPGGHVEANGYVAVEAEHFAENVPGADGSRWRPVEGLAQRDDAMKAFPETAARVDADFASTAKLKYRVYFSSTGTFTGTYYRVPTLNEGREDDGTPRTAQTAIGLDGNAPVLLAGCSTTSCGNAWGNNAMRQIEPLTFTVDVAKPGWHDLVVYRSDAAIAFDRIVVETRPGAAGDGLVGPAESPNDIARARQASVAPLPPEVANFRVLPAVTVPVGATRGVDGVDGAVTVTSDNETAVSAVLHNGVPTITGNRVGVAEITITTPGGMALLTATVAKAGGPRLGAYQERAGSVVIDPSDALERSEYANLVAGNDGTHTWALVRNGVQAVPVANSGAKANWLANTAAQAQALLAAGPADHVNGSAAAGAPPRLEFTVDIATGGTYYLFVNSSNPNPDADSYHVAVDGQWRYHSSKGTSETAAETWYGSTSLSAAALRLTPGRHTISLWAREAGFAANQLALTTDATPDLTGFQAPSQREQLDS